MSELTDASFVGDGLRIEGSIESEGDLLVEGEIQGDVTIRKLTIGQGGHVEGKITAAEVLVHGRVTGGIAAQSATLCKTARVEGDVEYGSLSIENGAEFEGRCTRRAGAARGAAPPPRLEAVGTGAR